jgi:hypothetical protein
MFSEVRAFLFHFVDFQISPSRLNQGKSGRKNKHYQKNNQEKKSDKRSASLFFVGNRETQQTVV